MRLGNLLKESLVEENLKASNKKEAIDELLGLIKKIKPATNVDAVRDVVLEREDIEDTSYGRGFAFPHARTDEVDDMYVAVGISKNGLGDETPDNVPLGAVVLLLTPSHISKLYLQTLSAFASFAREDGNLEKIRGASSKTELIDIIWQSAVTVDKEITVKDIMRYEVATVKSEDSLKHVANMMFKHRLSAMAVVDHDNRLLGQITDKDLIQAALPDYKTLIDNLNYSPETEPFEELLKQEDKIKVSQLYKDDHEVTSKDTMLVEVAAQMIFKDLRRVFVVEEEKLVGVLLRKDIVNMVIRG